MAAFQIGNPLLYEILAVEFVRHLDEFSLQRKVQILKCLASSDIDASNILKAVHTVCASTLEALAISQPDFDQSEGQVPVGLYTVE